MIIPAKKQKQMGNTIKKSEQKKLRVAAYCRVSTDSDEQETSYENVTFPVTTVLLRLFVVANAEIFTGEFIGIIMATSLSSGGVLPDWNLRPQILTARTGR